MKPIALTIAAVTCLAGTVVTFLVVRTFSIGSPELSFIIGAILGSQMGTFLHHRQPGARPTVAAKAILGGVLAVCAVAAGILLHLTANPFKFVEISVPVAAIGSFIFPFAIFNTLWNALSKKDSESKPTDE